MLSGDEPGPEIAVELTRAKHVGPGVDLSRAWVAALGGWLVIYATLGQRLYLPRGPGEAIPLAGVLTILLAVTVLAANGEARTLVASRFRETPWLLAFVSVWTLLGLAGPIVGYPPYTVFTAVVPISIAALCGFGFLLTAHRGFRISALRVPLLLIAWVQFTVGAMQALWYTGSLSLPPQRWLYIWDTRVSVAYGVEQIAGRSVGLYVNPNPYSLLGALLLVLAVALPFRLRNRFLIGLPAAGIVVLGASRSAVLALLLVAIPWAVIQLFAAKRGRLLGLLAAIGATGLIAVLAARWNEGVLYSRFAGRWASIPGLLTLGTAADANTAGRVEAWSKILPYWAQNPLGTFGPPQMAVSSFTDNDYITLLLQGGIILLATYVGALATALVRRSQSPIGSSIGPLVGVVALTGLTQTSIIMVPALALFWPAIGTTLHAAPAARVLPDDAGPRQIASSERRMLVRRRAATITLSATLLLVFLAAIGIRLVGRGFVFEEPAAPQSTRPTVSVDATTTVPPWRVEIDDGLGMYYLDLPPSDSPELVEDLSSPDVTAEEDERLSREWQPAPAQVRGKELVVPIAVAVQGLRDYTRYAATGDARFQEFSQLSADWLAEEQEPDGSWRYRYSTYDLSPGWASANVQSLAISLLARAAQDTDDDRYLGAARQAYAFMMTPVAEGGVQSTFPDGQPVLEGYANSRIAEHALSGALIGLIGVHDLAYVAADEEVRDSFDELSASMSSHLVQYNIGDWSRYSLGIANGPSSHLYHRLYVSELHVLAGLTGDERFELQAKRWDASLNEWVDSLDTASE